MIVKIILLFCAFLNAYCFDPTEKFDHSASLSDQSPRYTLFWRVKGQEIIFEVHAETKGWVGLGFNTNGGMVGADIVVFGTKDDKPYLNDYHSTAFARPTLDKQQDYELLYGAENATHTVTKFKRKLSTCDDNDLALSQDTVKVIWALNDKDIHNATDFNIHGQRGARSVMLLEMAKSQRTEIPKNVIVYDLNITNVSIPANPSTFYLCKILKMPDMPKHHIIKYEPIISSENRKFVHHIVVFHCLYDMSHFVDKQEPCFSDDQTKGSEMYKCTSRYLAGWGLGAESVVFGDNLGYPIFDKKHSPYLMLEFHYNNPDNIEGVIDNSAMRFYLTPTLRQNEIGSMIMGLGFDNKSILLPPGQKQISVKMNCDFKCTQNFPKSGINVLGAFLHQHSHGKSLKLRHVRNGTELPPIFEDNNYDFNYQEQRYLQKPRIVLPNDSLIVECSWNTLKTDKIVFGGYQSSEEMCLVFVDYYPRINGLLSCLGGPTPRSFAEAFNAKISKDQGLQPIIVQDKDGKKVSLSDYATTIDWGKKNKTFFNHYQNTLNNGLYFQYCSRYAEDKSDVKLGDFLGTVAGQSVFNPDGVKLLEHIQENVFVDLEFEEPKQIFNKPQLCKN